MGTKWLGGVALKLELHLFDTFLDERTRSFILLTMECQPGLKLISTSVEEGGKEMKETFLPQKQPCFPAFSISA